MTQLAGANAQVFHGVYEDRLNKQISIQEELLAPADKYEASQASTTITPGSFTPLHALQTALQFWWFVFLFSVIGGVAGFWFHRLNPQIYEAVGQFTVGIDFVATGPLTQYEEDVAFNAVTGLAYSSQVLEQVVAAAQAEGLAVDLRGLKSAAFVERKASLWVLRVRHTDPLVAEKLARIWTGQTHAALLEGYSHALQARQLSAYVSALENCLAKSVNVEPVHPLCNQQRFADIQADLQAAGKALFEERKASLGLFSGLLIGPVDGVFVDPSPVNFGRGQLVLAGSLIGLLAGVVVSQLGLPARWMRKP